MGTNGMTGAEGLSFAGIYNRNNPYEIGSQNWGDWEIEHKIYDAIIPYPVTSAIFKNGYFHFEYDGGSVSMGVPGFLSISGEIYERP